MYITGKKMRMNEEHNYVLEKGDFFVIDDAPQEIENPIGIKVRIMADFYGVVFEAKEVCVDHVAAKIIERGVSDDAGDMVISLNWRRHKISPVTKEYAEIFINSRQLDRDFSTLDGLDSEIFEGDEDDSNFRNPSA